MGLTNQLAEGVTRPLGSLSEFVIPACSTCDPVVAWIVDDTGLPRRAGVSVTSQYCGQWANRILLGSGQSFCNHEKISIRVRSACSYRSLGLKTASGGTKPKCQSRSGSRPNQALD